MTLEELLSRLDGVHQDGQKWRARCPGHNGKGNTSFSVTVGEGGCILLKCWGGCTLDDICAGAGISKSDLFPDDKRNGSKSEVVATYDYRDEQGELLYQVCRMSPKGFRQRRPDGKGGWLWKLGEVRRVPYRLPGLLADPKRAIWVVEGEKDADRLTELGLLATCNSEGAGKWRPEFSELLAGRPVLVVPDNDRAGRMHAAAVANSFVAVATKIRVVWLPGIPDAGDMSDWLNAGGTKDQLEQLAREAPNWTGDLPKVEPFETVTLDDRPPRPPDWQVRGLMERGTCTLLAACQKSGKTWWTILLSICLVTNRRFFRWAVECPTERVLLYTPESGWEARRRRLWGVVWGLGLDPKEVLPRLHIIRGRLNLTVEEHVERLQATVLHHDPGLVVVNPFVAAAAGVDENSAGEVQPILAALRDTCTNERRSLILAHHHNKGQGGSLANSVRGSGAFGGWWDTLVTIRREDADQSDSPRRVDIEHRDNPAPDPIGFQIEACAHHDAPDGVTAFRLDEVEAPTVNGSGKGSGSHNKVEAEAKRAKLLQLLEEKDGRTIKDLADLLERSERTVADYVAKLSPGVRREGNHVFLVRAS